MAYTWSTLTFDGMTTDARLNYEDDVSTWEERSLFSQLAQISAKMLSIEVLVAGAVGFDSWAGKLVLPSKESVCLAIPPPEKF